MLQTTISHQPAVGSDHCPLLMEMEVRIDEKVKHFKFLHCWTENEKFNDIVQSSWQEEVSGDPMRKLY